MYSNSDSGSGASSPAGSCPPSPTVSELRAALSMLNAEMEAEAAEEEANARAAAEVARVATAEYSREPVVPALMSLAARPDSPTGSEMSELSVVSSAAPRSVRSVSTARSTQSRALTGRSRGGAAPPQRSARSSTMSTARREEAREMKAQLAAQREREFVSRMSEDSSRRHYTRMLNDLKKQDPTFDASPFEAPSSKKTAPVAAERRNSGPKIARHSQVKIAEQRGRHKWGPLGGYW